MKSDTDHSINHITAYFGGTLFIFFITFYAVINDNLNDYIQHANWVAELSIRHLFGFMQNYAAYPLWHIITKTFYKIFQFNLYDATAITTALFNCFAYRCVLWVWDSFTHSPLSPFAKSFWACCLFLVGPLYAPWFSEHYYLGQGSGNVWHNPTNIAVKGFAILCFALIIQLLKSQKNIKEEIGKYILLGVLILFSALAKPSFLQGIIPGLGIYFILSAIINKGERKHLLIKYLAIAGAFIPATFLLLFQFIFSFWMDTTIHNSESISIGFGRALGYWTPNLLISFLLAFAFSLFIFVLDFKNLLKKIHVQVALCYELCA